MDACPTDPSRAAHGTGHRAGWMHTGRWGLFLHLLAGPAGTGQGRDLDPEAWDRRVDAVDAEGLAAQAGRLGAGWVAITIGQNSGHFCAPNPVYDAIAGIRPSRCSRRDLIADLHAALSPRGIRLIAYLPSGAPEHDAQAVAAFGWRKGAAIPDFQRRWESVIRAWSLGWGARVDAWWFDGCYWCDRMYRGAGEPNFASFAAAARAGNPAAALAWNQGASLEPGRSNAEEDYTAGEVDEPGQVEIPGRLVDGAQVHVLSYLGATWGAAPVRFAPAQAAAITQAICAPGGALTWDVPITDRGLIASDALPALAAVAAAAGALRGRPDQAVVPAPSLHLDIPCVPQPGRPGAARLTLANRGGTGMAGRLRLAVEPAAAARLLAATEVDYRLAPGERLAVDLPLVAEAAAAPALLAVERLADGRRFAFPLPVRRRLALPAIAAASPEAAAAALAALPEQPLRTADGRALGALHLARCGDRLAVLCHAFDPEPATTPAIWDGSCLELFAALPDGPVRQLLLAPALGGGPARAVRVEPAEHRHEPVADPATSLLLRSASRPGGWSLTALVPLAWWLGGGEGSPEALLLDGILGAAGSRAAWSGDLAAARRSQAYALVAVSGDGAPGR